MPTKLKLKAVEESTYVLSVTFEDEAETEMVPTAIKWKLTDMAGTVINNREDVVVTPASEVSIVLSGDDLAVPGTRPLERVLTVYGTYNSSYGSDLPFVDSATFTIENLQGF